LAAFPFDEKRILSSTGALNLKEIPSKMVVIGAGAIGLELGSVFRRLGSEVAFVEFADRICPTLDASLSKGLQKQLTSQGMQFYLSHKAVRIDQRELVIQGVSSEEKKLPFDVILVAVGRKPYVQGLGLENVGIELDPHGFIPVSPTFQTKCKSIFAIGDLIEGPMLAHKASEEGMMVAEWLAGKKPELDYASIPNVIYTNPEVASVGFTEEELKAKKVSYKVALASFKVNPRAHCMGEEEGFVKILAETKSRRLLGVHILGPLASELIQEPVYALSLRSTVDQLKKACHAHPTLSETIKEALIALRF
jgi:dihydrolipoamide dehydrogenase